MTAPSRAIAGHTIDQQHVAEDVPINVIAHMVLDGRTPVDVLADFGEHLVPGPTDLLIKVPTQRAKMFVEEFPLPQPALAYAFLARRAFLAIPP